MADKVAVFGGTFNPVHNGHITLAKAAMAECKLSKIVFLPNGVPPHKTNQCIPDAKSRYDMVSLAICGCDGFEISDYEIKRDKPSYTVDTIPYMKSIYGDDISFIIGADSLCELGKWKDYKTLIGQCSFIAAFRSGHTAYDITNAVAEITNMGGKVTLLSMPKIDITSTFIRKCIAIGKPFSQYVPHNVYEYITNNKLYQSYLEDENDN